LTDDDSFKDAIALQLPQNPDGQKPYFLNGDPENPAYLLQWSAHKEGSITEINATGMKRMVAQKEGNQNAKGAVVYDNGEYRLLIKRSLKTDDKKDAQFEPGKFIPVAFSAWEGSNEETGTKRSISAWYFLILEAQIPKTVYYYPLLAIIIVAAFEFSLIKLIRKKK
jgi:DMSO reductase family type II enzyme heme b subunit